MLAPTCRNPNCAELDIPKPYYAPASDPVPDQPPPADWFCGTCGDVCEVVEQPDTPRST